MLHVARSLAVPTYHIRPMGGTASFHEGKQRATRPSVSGVSSSAGTAGWRSLAAQARPVKAYHTTIHPFGACLRCKKATIVAELTHWFRRRGHGYRPSSDQVCAGSPGVCLSLAMRLPPCRRRQTMHVPLYWRPEAGSGHSSRSRRRFAQLIPVPRRKSVGTAAVSGTATG